jgi:hypothetical protein
MQMPKTIAEGEKATPIVEFNDLILKQHDALKQILGEIIKEDYSIQRKRKEAQST